ncbi:MAG TPA: site-2 protease family protein [Acidimicrobiia bacterium]|nr:site-2 protease family protein [Acidimicrobiia bacterium]
MSNAPVQTRAARRHGSFPIGRIAGIEIRVHWSFFILVALFVLASTAPEGLGIASSLVWLVVIFGCVLLHELAHCLVGRRRGAVVHEIELLPIGGVSKLERLPEEPRDEFAMAIAGPLASVAIAGVAGLVATLALVPLLPFTMYNGPLLARTFWFNLVIAAFNLLPAFPLDGGRVFRALLERRHDLLTATRIAVRVGHGVAVALVVVGLFFNLWFVIIGVFVYMGATMEEAATVVHVGLRNRRADQLMLLDPVIVEAGTPAVELQALLQREHQRVFPVVEHGRYVGLLDDLRIRRAAPSARADDLAVRELLMLDPTDGVEDRVSDLVGTPTRALAVGSSDAIVGLLRVEDIEHLLRDEAQHRSAPSPKAAG